MPAHGSGQRSEAAGDGAAGGSQRRQRIAATLATRASVFGALQQGDPAQIAALLRRSQVDPLSALIAYSASDPSLRNRPVPLPPQPGLQGVFQRLAPRLPWLAAPDPGESQSPSPLEKLGACPELGPALRAGWRRHGLRGPGSPPLQPGRGAGPASTRPPLRS